MDNKNVWVPIGPEEIADCFKNKDVASINFCPRPADFPEDKYGHLFSFKDGSFLYIHSDAEFVYTDTFSDWEPPQYHYKEAICPTCERPL